MPGVRHFATAGTFQGCRHVFGPCCWAHLHTAPNPSPCGPGSSPAVRFAAAAAASSACDGSGSASSAAASSSTCRRAAASPGASRSCSTTWRSAALRPSMPKAVQASTALVATVALAAVFWGQKTGTAHRAGLTHGLLAAACCRPDAHGLKTTYHQHTEDHASRCPHNP